MEFIKNELIDEILKRYFKTFAITLDTAEFVPAKYGKKIHRYIFKNMKNKFHEVNREYKRMRKAGGEALGLPASAPASAVCAKS